MTGSLRCETGLQCRQRRRRPPPAHAALACQLRPTHPACLPACLPACRRPDGGLLRLPLRPGNSQLSQGALQGSVVGDSDTRRAHRWRIGRASLLTGSAEPDRTALDEGAARDGIGRSQGGGCPVPGAWCLVPRTHRAALRSCGDPGQIDGAPSGSSAARVEAPRAAGPQCRSRSIGRLNHVERTRRWRSLAAQGRVASENGKNRTTRASPVVKC